MTSPSGTTWTLRATPNNNNTWSSVCYNGSNLFVAVANTGTGKRVMTSANGTTWTSATGTVQANSWISVCYGNSLFVSV